MTRLALVPLLHVALLAACSGDDPEQLTRDGIAALNAGDAAGAYARLHEAAEALPDDHPRSLEARVGLCRALAHRSPDGCVAAFDRLAAERADLQAGDIELVTHELLGVGAYGGAAGVLEASLGLDRFKDSERLLKLLDEAGKAAEKAGDKAALKRLQGLGYT